MRLAGLFKPRFPQTAQIELKDGPANVSVRVSARARRYRLTLSPRGEPVITVPASGRWTDAQAFLERNAGWLDARLAHRGDIPALAPGAQLPLRGRDHLLVSKPELRGVVCVVPGEVHVPGGPAHFRRRLIDWLKTEARHDLEARCAIHAQTLGVQIASIRLRDQSTRWGSCSSTRNLNFNWRLILAPDFVLDYVAAHEVAHILEMNHAPAFWRTVARALPDYERGKAWLKANGGKLMAIG